MVKEHLPDFDPFTWVLCFFCRTYSDHKVSKQHSAECTFCGLCKRDFPTHAAVIAHLRASHPRRRVMEWHYCVPYNRKFLVTLAEDPTRERYILYGFDAKTW